MSGLLAPSKTSWTAIGSALGMETVCSHQVHVYTMLGRVGLGYTEVTLYQNPGYRRIVLMLFTSMTCP